MYNARIDPRISNSGQDSPKTFKWATFYVQSRIDPRISNSGQELYVQCQD